MESEEFKEIKIDNIDHALDMLEDIVSSLPDMHESLSSQAIVERVSVISYISKKILGENIDFGIFVVGEDDRLTLQASSCLPDSSSAEINFVKIGEIYKNNLMNYEDGRQFLIDEKFISVDGDVEDFILNGIDFDNDEVAYEDYDEIVDDDDDEDFYEQSTH